MRRFDWQAYADGTMPEEERRMAEDELRKNPQAQAELEGLNRLRTEVRAAGQSVPVPEEALRRRLQHATRRPNWLILIGGTASAGLAVAAALWAAFIYDPMRLDTSPERDAYATADAGEAARWVRTESGIPAPSLDPEPVGELLMARVGDRWACFDYEVQDQVIIVYMSRRVDSLRAGRPVRELGTTLYHGRGIGWQQGDLAFYMKGGDAETRERLLRRLLRTQTSLQRPRLSARSISQV